MDGLSDFLAVMGYAWKLLTMERYIYGFVFSYGRLVLMLVTAGICCFLIRKGFFDD